MSDARFRMAAAAIAALFPAVLLPASPQRDGKAIVDEVCAVCHGAGVEGAPRIGDKKAWSGRASRGLSSLTDSAMAGVRRMPPHGMRLELDNADLKRAITYMVNQSGGNWIEPIDRARPTQPRTGAQIVVAQCSKCHEAGTRGAPRFGDKDAWVRRASQGFDSLVSSAIHGHGAMPARGGMPDLTDQELRAAVQFLFQNSVNGRAADGRTARDVVAHAGEDIVKQRCARCHAPGASNAPGIGDAAAWRTLKTQGLGNLVNAALRNHAELPQRGGLGSLNEDELRAAVGYMMEDRTWITAAAPPRR